MTMLNLDDFDPEAIQAWQITPNDLNRVLQYVNKLQGNLTHTTLDDIRIGGIYGTSALLHEVVEVRILLGRDPMLLRRHPSDIAAFLAVNPDAHLQGLAEEYTYLQRQIHRRFRVWCNIGALVQANGPAAWEDIFDTDLPFTEPTEAAVFQAQAWLNRLKEVSQ